jgi:NDP-sugar pyrophosphorylase family protein
MVIGFVEKPELPHWINAGVYVLERSIEPLLPAKGDHEDTTFPQLTVQRKLAGFPIRVPWKYVDSHKDLREAEPVAEALAKSIGAM